jgi:hypothetical protein
MTYWSTPCALKNAAGQLDRRDIDTLSALLEPARE